MQDEMILEVDKNDEIIGLIPRSKITDSNVIHRSTVLFLFNSKDEILLQKRSLNKWWGPGKFDFSAGGISGDEKVSDCMKRELNEELGISCNIKFLFNMTPMEKNDNAYQHVFKSISDDEIIIDKNEVDSVKWISIEKLKNEIHLNPNNFTKEFIYGFQKYLKLKKI